ncbi:MAG TPA: DMT family transporter [Nitriliruptorales bacterium]|nr:DMT family transporter [Nitriliruptorales bacterium]
MLSHPLLSTWVGVVLISFSGVWVRLAGVEPARSAFLRNAYALPVLAGLVLWVRSRRGHPARQPLLPVAVAAGVLLAADLIAWHASLGIIGVGLGTVLPNLQVVFVGLVSLVAFGERPHGGFWLALPVVLGGVWLLGAFGRPVVTGGSVLAGVALGVVAALCYSGFLVGLRVARLRRPGANAVETLASATLGATLASGTFAAVEGAVGPAPTWAANGWLLALALGSQVAGWLLLTASIHRLPAALTSVALLLQPLLALLWGAALLDEPIGAGQVAGAAVLLLGVAGAHRAVVAGQREVPDEVALPVGDETLV